MLWELTHRKIPYSGREPMLVALEVSRSGLRPTIAEGIDPEITGIIHFVT